MPEPVEHLLGASPKSDKEIRKLPSANRGLAILNPDGDGVSEIVHDMALAEPRIQYAPMKAHMELASQVIAVGGTYTMAARYAGVGRRQVKKYMMSPDFRARIEEHRAKMTSGIRGRIISELGRRTKGKNIHNWEIMDLVRVLDRISTGGKGMITVEGDLNVTNNKYESILAALFGPNAGPEGTDFPRFGDSGDVVPGESTSVDS